jgi:hypothetical protein
MTSGGKVNAVGIRRRFGFVGRARFMLLRCYRAASEHSNSKIATDEVLSAAYEMTIVP